MEVHRASRAKINLFLEVVGKREDGYHNLETIFQELDLSDDIILTIGKSSGIAIQTDSEDIPSDASNLAYRAAEVFFSGTRIKADLEIRIIKRIPVAAGLGGGSSNAAAVLNGLIDLFHPGLSQKKIHEMARSLGADVPFFLSGGTALGRGIGDLLEPIRRRLDFYVVLINPRFKLPTPDVYRALSLNLTSLNSGINLVKDALEGADFEGLSSRLFNRLEHFSLSRFMPLMDFKIWIQSLGVDGVLLSGSGPTMFCLLKSEAEANSLRRVIDERYQSRWWTCVARVH